MAESVRVSAKLWARWMYIPEGVLTSYGATASVSAESSRELVGVQQRFSLRCFMKFRGFL